MQLYPNTWGVKKLHFAKLVWRAEDSQVTTTCLHHNRSRALSCLIVEVLVTVSLPGSWLEGVSFRRDHFIACSIPGSFALCCGWLPYFWMSPILLGFPPIVLQETQKQKKGQAVKKSKAEKDTLSGPNLPRNLQLILGKGWSLKIKTPCASPHPRPKKWSFSGCPTQISTVTTFSSPDLMMELWACSTNLWENWRK